MYYADDVIASHCTIHTFSVNRTITGPIELQLSKPQPSSLLWLYSHLSQDICNGNCIKSTCILNIVRTVTFCILLVIASSHLDYILLISIFHFHHSPLPLLSSFSLYQTLIELFSTTIHLQPLSTYPSPSYAFSLSFINFLSHHLVKHLIMDYEDILIV